MTDQQLAQIVWEYLRYERPLQKADVIIGLGSHDTRTAEWCAKLYEEGWAPLVVFCGDRGKLTAHIERSEADRYAEIAIRHGVPDGDIIRETTSRNTGENIVNTYHLLRERDITPKRTILVTKPYMLRRAYATCMKQWPADDVPEVICSALNKGLVEYGEGLEKLGDTIALMLGVLQRIREYPNYGFQIEQEIPDNVWTAYEELIRRGYDEHIIQ